MNGIELARKYSRGDIVVLCEKSLQRRAIEAAFGSLFPIVIALEGHCYRPRSPDETNEELKRQAWDQGVVLIPEDRKFEWVFNDGNGDKKLAGLIKRKREAVRELGKVARKAKILIISTDVDDEGEWIAWSALHRELGWWIDSHGKTEIWRALFTEPDKTSVTKAFANLIPPEETFGRALAGKTRAEADMAVGYTLSAGATGCLRPRDVPRGTPALNQGRVKNGVVGMLCQIEHAIRNHVPELYFEIEAGTDVPGLTLRHAPRPEKRILDRAVADGLAALADTAQGPLSVRKERKRKGPPKLFNTTTLQVAAAKAFGWSAKRTDELANELYHAGVITYPRGECEILNSDEAKANAPGLLAQIARFHPDWATPQDPVLRASMFNTAEARKFPHEAIIPNINCDGGLLAALNGLAGDQAKLAALICERFVQGLSPDAEYDSTVATLELHHPTHGAITFSASGSVTVSDGWRAMGGRISGSGGGNGPDDARALPPIGDGQVVTLGPVGVVAKQTEPPKRISAAELTEEMSKAHRHVRDPRLAKVMQGVEGLGTGATRSTVEQELYAAELIAKGGARGKDVVPTERVYLLWCAFQAVDPILYDPGWSALWEQQFQRIRERSLEPRAFLDVLAADLDHHLGIFRATPPLPASVFGAAAPKGGGPGGGAGGATRGAKPGGRSKRRFGLGRRSAAV